MSKRFIVKVQLPLSSTDPHAPALIYNRDRSIVYRPQITPSLKLRLLGAGFKKRFFYAHLNGTILVLEEEAPWQDW